METMARSSGRGAVGIEICVWWVVNVDGGPGGWARRVYLHTDLDLLEAGAAGRCGEGRRKAPPNDSRSSRASAAASSRTGGAICHTDRSCGEWNDWVVNWIGWDGNLDVGEVQAQEIASGRTPRNNNPRNTVTTSAT